MVGFRRGGHEQTKVFEVDDATLSKHCFDNDDTFHRVKQYYESLEYRSAAPAESFDQVHSALPGRGYGLVVCDASDEVVVVEYPAE